MSSSACPSSGGASGSSCAAAGRIEGTSYVAPVRGTRLLVVEVAARSGLDVLGGGAAAEASHASGRMRSRGRWLVALVGMRIVTVDASVAVISTVTTGWLATASVNNFPGASCIAIVA